MPLLPHASTAVQVLVTVTVQPFTLSASTKVGVMEAVHASLTVGVPKAAVIAAAFGLQSSVPLLAGVITGGVTSLV